MREWFAHIRVVFMSKNNNMVPFVWMSSCIWFRPAYQIDEFSRNIKRWPKSGRAIIQFSPKRLLLRPPSKDSFLLCSRYIFCSRFFFSSLILCICANTNEYKQIKTHLNGRDAGREKQASTAIKYECMVEVLFGDRRSVGNAHRRFTKICFSFSFGRQKKSSRIIYELTCFDVLAAMRSLAIIIDIHDGQNCGSSTASFAKIGYVLVTRGGK